jgi:hypothetical protein
MMRGRTVVTGLVLGLILHLDWHVPVEWVRAHAKSPFTVSSSTVKWIVIRMFLKTASYAPRTAGRPDAVGKPAGMKTPSSV